MPEKKVNKDEIIAAVYSGTINPENLPKELYYETANILKKGAYKGYGGLLAEFKFDSPDYETLAELRENIYMFSAAKTFQQTLEMTQELVGDNDEIIPFKEFKEACLEIYKRYNGEDIDVSINELKGWIKAEYDTAVGMSRSAAKWVNVVKAKATHPYLKYIAVMDAHTCPICLPLDGIILPITDSFWSTNMPLNHFNCECTVEQLDIQDAEEEGVTPDEEVIKNVKMSEETKDKLFNMNPGMDKTIFKDTGRNQHPYFEVSQRYRELARNNFNLDIPTTDE